MALQFNWGSTNNDGADVTPVANPPEGVHSDIQGNPDNKSGVMIALSTIFLAAMMIAVGIRAFVKSRILHSWSWDDVTLGLGFLGTIGVYILTCMFGVLSKVGSHVWNVPIGVVYSTTWTSENNCFDTLVPLTMLFVKISFFIYLFNNFYSYRWLRLTSMIGMVITTLFYAAIVIAQLSVWVRKPGEPLPLTIPGDKAWAMNVMMFIMSCGGLVLDLVIWTLPIIAIAKFELSGRKTCGVGCIFVVGFVAIVASTLSVIYRARSNMNWDSDFLFLGMPTVLCTFIELSAGCIAASLPSLVLFCNHFNRKSQLKRSASHTRNRAVPLAHNTDDTEVELSTPDRGRRQYLNRKASVLSDGVATITEHMIHPFSKLGELSRKSSLTALPQVGRDGSVVEMQPRRSSSADALATNSSVMATLDEQAQQMSARSFENFRSRDIEPWERWEALKNWPPEPPETHVGKATKRYMFGD